MFKRYLSDNFGLERLALESHETIRALAFLVENILCDSKGAVPVRAEAAAKISRKNFFTTPDDSPIRNVDTNSQF